MRNIIDDLKTMTRNKKDSIITGVCSSIAETYKWDAFWVRIIWALIFMTFPVIAVPIYLLILVIMLKNEDRSSLDENKEQVND